MNSKKVKYEISEMSFGKVIKVESFHQLQNHNQIQNKLKLTTKNGLIKEINKISPLQVGQSKTIVFYEKIQIIS